MSQSTTPPAKRLKQSSLGDYFTQKKSTVMEQAITGASSSAQENLNSMENLKLCDAGEGRCVEEIKKIVSSRQSSESEESVNCEVTDDSSRVNPVEDMNEDHLEIEDSQKIHADEVEGTPPSLQSGLQSSVIEKVCEMDPNIKILNSIVQSSISFNISI